MSENTGDRDESRLGGDRLVEDDQPTTAHRLEAEDPSAADTSFPGLGKPC